MTLDALREQLAIRYSEDLYLGYGKGFLYHFVYGYKRFIIEIVRTLLALIRYPASRLTMNAPSISIFATYNQKKALKGLHRYNGVSEDLAYIYNLSFGFNLVRLAVWISKLFIFPFSLAISKNKEGEYFSCNTFGMKLYNNLLIRRMQSSGVNRISLSNDHAGDIFILSLLLRRNEDIEVVYVQHGAVKDSFPSNEFDYIYVVDDHTKRIYERLSTNEAVRIFVMEEDSLKSQEKLDPVDILVCFSHQFYIANTITLFRFLSKSDYTPVFVRFHPSDRLAGIKLKFIALFCRVSLSSGDVPFEKDFLRSRVVISASSSLLKDAVSKHISQNLVWYKPIGLAWDYYNLESQLSVADNVSDLEYQIGRLVR